MDKHTGSIKRHETQRGEMAPDVYGGDNCDKVLPRWKVEADGDRGSDDFEPVVRLAARNFPPGTIISIQEPLCPSCGELREPNLFGRKPYSRKPLYEGPCRCGFDWDAWVLEQYS